MEGLYMNRFQDRVSTAIRKVNDKINGEIYLVGGAVRDMLMDRDADDLDFVVIGDYEAYAKAIAKELRRPAIPFKDNIRIPYGTDSYLDVSAPRGATIEEDLRHRDFTINNLAMAMNGDIIGDRSDIDAKRIVPVHEQVFDDDPVRILRGFRQAAQLDFALSEDFLRLAKAKTSLLPTVAGERIYEELKKLNHAQYATVELFQHMQDCGVWQLIAGCKPDITKLMKVYELKIHDMVGDVRLMFFLATIFADGDMRLLDKLHPSKNVQRMCEVMINDTTDFMQREPQEAVWAYRKHFALLRIFAQLYYGFDTEAVNGAFDNIKSYHGYLVDGDTMLAIARRTAPELKGGRWIAEIMDECNYKLTFGELAEAGAEDYVEERINALRSL
jgi:tRNA nucleotidyltransferase/poly(A) polymerase